MFIWKLGEVTAKRVIYEVPISGGTFKMISLNIIGLRRKGSLQNFIFGVLLEEILMFPSI